MSLDEFCASLSATDKRVETISAFHLIETKAGHLNDTPINFTARYESFRTSPV